MSFMQVKNKEELYIYYIVVIVGYVLVFFSEPFLRYPYDIFAHLIAIDEKYHNLPGTTTSIQPGRLVWHTIWAKIFQVFHIDSIDFLLRAKIIHVVQTYISLFSIYYFSHVVLRNLFINISDIALKYLSLWSLLIWVTIFATFSMYYHLIWTLWYSVSYQITLPLFFYIVALTLVLFLEEVSFAKKMFYLLQIALISIFILKAHPMEFIYYLMYLSVLSFVYMNKVFGYVKKYYYWIIFSIGIFAYLIHYFDIEDTKLVTYLNPNHIFSLYGDIVSIGTKVVVHYNRAVYAINELMYMIYYIGIFICFVLFLDVYQERRYVNVRLFIFILLTSLFILIPQYAISAGFFALITKEYVVHRVYYSASLFILLPIFVYYISVRYRFGLYFINFILALVIATVFLYSKYNTSSGHIYYQNMQSIVNSFSKKYAFHFSQDDMQYIAERIKEYEKTRRYKDRDNLYFAREDIAFVIKYIYGKRAYWLGRRALVNYHSACLKNSKYTTYNYILFKTKKDFPDNPLFK